MAQGEVPRGTVPEFHVWERKPSEGELAAWVARWLPYLGGRRLLDLGCGEGHVTAAFRKAGYDIEGVEVHPELAARAREKGLVVHLADAVQFVEAHGESYDGIIMFDFVEHLPFTAAARILNALRPGSVCVIQTPNTNSIIGHQFYMQVPSHVAPYSPFVLQRMFDRAGIETLTTGTLYGGLPWTGLRRKLAEFLLVKLVGVVTARLLTEGANYYVVGKRRHS